MHLLFGKWDGAIFRIWCSTTLTKMLFFTNLKWYLRMTWCCSCIGMLLDSLCFLRGTTKRQFRADLNLDPFASHTVVHIPEAPRPPRDISGQSLNRAHKSYIGWASLANDFVGIMNYINLWGTPSSNPAEGWIFSMMEGLGPVVQAAITLGLPQRVNNFFRHVECCMCGKGSGTI